MLEIADREKVAFPGFDSVVLSYHQRRAALRMEFDSARARWRWATRTPSGSCTVLTFLRCISTSGRTTLDGPRTRRDVGGVESGGVDLEHPTQGWYRDSWGLAEVRWWDGRQWTAGVRRPAGGSPPGRRRRRGLLLAFLALVGVAVMVATVLGFLGVSRELTAGIFDIAWAPDGQRLAYTTDSDLWVVPADGRCPTWVIDWSSSQGSAV